MKKILILLALCLLVPFQLVHAFYDPILGRWLTRDPLHELGAIMTRDLEPRFHDYGLTTQGYNPNINPHYFHKQPVKSITETYPGKVLYNPKDSVNPYIFVRNDPVNLIDPLGLIPLDTVWDAGNILYDIAVGDYAALAGDTAAFFTPYVPAGTSKLLRAASVAVQMESRLSDPNPVPKTIREAYEDIQIGQGCPRRDDSGNQKEFQAHELKQFEKSANVWEGAKEWGVPGTNHRILERKDGTWGYVLQHDYSNPKPFPKPWY